MRISDWSSDVCSSDLRPRPSGQHQKIFTMLNFIARRVFQSIFVMLAVGFIAFAMFRFVGDPINNLVGQDTTMAQREQLKERLGLNDPFFVQYARFIGNDAHGDFGVSYTQLVPVSEMLTTRMPAPPRLTFAS